MKRRPVHAWTALLLAVVFLVPRGLPAQQDKVAALTQSLAANQKLLQQYRWVETTVISLKGVEKSRVQKQCSYGPDGKVQKQSLSAPSPKDPAPDGVTAAMNQAVSLVHSYVPPDSKRVQATKAAGNLAISPLGQDSVRLDLRNYLKSGDTFSFGLDTAANVLTTLSVKSYLASEKDAVTLEVTFARLRDGLSYPGTVVLSVPDEKIQVVVQNANYQRITPAASAVPEPTAAKPGATAAAKPVAASTAALDTLLGPIALYPDALIAQILEASKDSAAVQKFSGWLKSNSALKGTQLQDAAKKAGFAVCYIALAPFPQVVQMLVEKPDWTKQLGAAVTSDQAAVYQSIQRLRAAAMALGNLKTTEQQEVVTETTSAGQTIILVQPANPQVVYVPVYNTQVVYVQQAPPPSSSANVAAAAMIGFTAGVIIASSSNNYYYGPYAWRGGGYAYHEAYERREDYIDDRQDYAEDRRENAQDIQNERRENAQNNQSQRQSTAQANQSTRQGTAQASQSTRQTAASSGSGGATAQANQTNRQSTPKASQTSRQSTARSGGGYQSGAAARSQSSRGSASRGGRGR